MFFKRNFKKLMTMAIILYLISLITSCEAKTSTGSAQVALDRTPKFFRENCTCPTNWQCECCANVDNDLFNLHQALCIDWSVFVTSWSMQISVRLNENVIYKNTFSVWDIPPFCVPLWPALALTGCIKMHSVIQHEDNSFHGCANVTINLITFNIINFQMVCMDIGTDGIHFVEPNHPVVSASSTEKPPELELERSDLIKPVASIMKHINHKEDDTMSSSVLREDSLSYLKRQNF